MEKKEKFPSSFEEFYKKITELNKNNKLKINREVARKYYDYIKSIKEGPTYEESTTKFKSGLTEKEKQDIGDAAYELEKMMKKRPTTKEEFKNSIFKNLTGSIKFINKDTKDYFDKCPNCGNSLIFTRGSSISDISGFYPKGCFCLNCGKSFVVGGIRVREIEKPFFQHSKL